MSDNGGFTYIILFNFCPNAKNAKFNSTPNLVDLQYYLIKPGYISHLLTTIYFIAFPTREHLNTFKQSQDFVFHATSLQYSIQVPSDWLPTILVQFEPRQLRLKSHGS